MGTLSLAVVPPTALRGAAWRALEQTTVAQQVEQRDTPATSPADDPQDVNEHLDRTAHGQAVTSRALRRLRDRGWMHFDDLHWPGRARAIIDHVAVGPGGVIVVTTVHWMGAVDVQAGQIRHNGRPSAAQWACEAAADAVRRVLPAETHPFVVPALAIVTDEPIDALAGGVLTCSTTRLEAVLARRRVVLDDRQVARTAAVLWGTLSIGGGRRPRPSGAQGPAARLLDRCRRWLHRRSG